tara:strand:+ start:712 stop:1518 length:807 start_codon:yes stop_codon:yes gene_type:complete
MDVLSLEPLIKHKNIEYNRVAANLLEKFAAKNTDLVKLLFSNDDSICKTKAAEFILRANDEQGFFEKLIQLKNSRLKIIALQSKYSNRAVLVEALEDESTKVVEQSLVMLIQMEHKIEGEVIDSLTKRGVKLSLLIPYLVKHYPDKLVDSISNINKLETKILVDALLKQCEDISQEPIRSLISNKKHIIVGRWLQGKKGKDVDELRWNIIADDNVDEIERSRFIERLFSRCDEEEIIAKAEEISRNSESELIRITAHNLSTAKDRGQT